MRQRLLFIRSPNDADVKNKPKNTRLQIQSTGRANNSFSVEYDVGGYLGRSEKLTSPEEVIAAGRGVCCGYSSLCSEMCR